MKRWLLFFVVFLLPACSAPATDVNQVAAPVVMEAPTETLPTVADLPDLGEAPELTNEVWLNTDAPLRLADLRGKVVLLDMWTFG